MVSLLISLFVCNPHFRREAELLRTWHAVCWVESRGDPYTRPGDGGRAVGIAQIHPQMVDDCNRIASLKSKIEDRRAKMWRLTDRQDPVQAYEMFRTYCLHYWPHGGPQQWARGWNGGPRGPRRPATLPYWGKVQNALRARTK